MEAPVFPDLIFSEFSRLYSGEPRYYQAPGRINIIGEHTDYNDGFVMPATVDLFTSAAVSPRDDRILRVHACMYGQADAIDLDCIEVGDHGGWIEYVKAVAWSLGRENLQLRGADIVIAGDIPLGGGLSSSASVEVLLAYALLDCSGIRMDREMIARICQRAESEFVGVQCGIMDQFIIACGTRQSAMLLDCRSLDYEHVNLPSNARFLLTHSGVRRHLSTGAYNSRPEECSRAVRLLSDKIPGLKSLRDLDMEQLETHESLLDDVLYRRCRHVLTENTRVQQVRDALKQGNVEGVGRLLNESHNSLRDDYEVSCPELNNLVNIALGCEGVMGSRMMGAGFGGCTISLVESHKLEQVASEIKRTYASILGSEPWIHPVGPAAAVNRIEAPSA